MGGSKPARGEPERPAASAEGGTASAEIERLKDELVSIVSHELRTPLTSIRGALKLLEGGVAGELAPEVAALVAVASKNTERLVRVVDDILDLQRIDAGALKLQLSALAPEVVADAALEAVAGAASERGVELSSRGSGPRLRADPDRLVQVLVNLLSNAIKFSPPGERVSIAVTSGEGGSVRFSVEDHGPGIAAEELPRVFERFRQLDSSDRREAGGAGLGLFISRAIVEQHRGRIGVDSKLGEGSVFWVEVPRWSSEQEIEAPPPGQPHQEAADATRTTRG